MKEETILVLEASAVSAPLAVEYHLDVAVDVLKAVPEVVDLLEEYLADLDDKLGALVWWANGGKLSDQCQSLARQRDKCAATINRLVSP